MLDEDEPLMGTMMPHQGENDDEGGDPSADNMYGTIKRETSAVDGRVSNPSALRNGGEKTEIATGSDEAHQ